MTKATVTETVDKYILLQAEIKRKTEELETLGAEIKSFGPCKLVGTAGLVEVSEVAGRKTTEWKLVCAAANVPQDVVDKYTKIGNPSYRINVTTKV